jgi:hypothetical protein
MLRVTESHVPDQPDTTTPPDRIVPGPLPRVGVEPSYVWAIGRVEPRFPSLAVEKEFAQATGRAETAGLTDRAALQSVLAERSNRYLARTMCWVFTIEGIENYVLRPADPTNIELLIEAVRPAPNQTDVDVVIGIRGPDAIPGDPCHGLGLPVVAFDQLFSFDVESFVASIPRPDTVPEEDFRPSVGELFSRVQQLADNSGAADEHRAINYLAVRYPPVYALTADAFARNQSLTAVDVRPSRLTGVRKIADVIFSFTHRATDVTEQHFVRVDVTEEFPFLVSKLSPFYSR